MAEFPWMKFFGGSWQSDPALRSCGAEARGVWIELVCIMAANDNGSYGYLCQNGRITIGLTPPVIQRLAGLVESEVERGLEELEGNGVFSRTEHGVIYCRRMVKEAKKLKTCRENGRRGGNPRLSPSVNPPVNPPVIPAANPQKLEVRRQKLDIKKERERETLQDKPAAHAPVICQSQKPEKKQEPKKRYGGGDRVLLTETEFNRLIEDYGLEPVHHQIEALDLYLGKISPKKARDNYHDHNLTIRSWFIRDGAKKQKTEAQKRADEAAEEECRRLADKKLVDDYNREHGLEPSAAAPTSEQVQMAIDELQQGGGDGTDDAR